MPSQVRSKAQQKPYRIGSGLPPHRVGANYWLERSMTRKHQLMPDMTFVLPTGWVLTPLKQA